jgi:hypothetical protein
MLPREEPAASVFRAPTSITRQPNCADTEADSDSYRGLRSEAMKNQVPKYVTQARASFLLGLPDAELTRISQGLGLGRVERAGDEEETYFTYEELQRICMLAAQQMQVVH